MKLRTYEELLVSVLATALLALICISIASVAVGLWRGNCEHSAVSTVVESPARPDVVETTGAGHSYPRESSGPRVR